jgi:hypothetical protein
VRRSLVAVLVAGLLSGGCGATDPTADSSDFVEIPGLGSTRIDVPRPTSPSTTTCGADGLPTPSAESMTERVSALRAIGLFADRTDASDEDVTADVATSIKAEWGEQIAPDDPLIDLFVAEQDHDRVWWRDLEADVAEENHVYEQTLTEWAAISVGSFSPTAISEQWDSPAGPVTVAFELDGATQSLDPAYLEDWIDLGILTGINERIASSGRRFESYRAFDQTAFVMALTPDERLALARDRGWCFE